MTSLSSLQTMDEQLQKKLDEAVAMVQVLDSDMQSAVGEEVDKAVSEISEFMMTEFLPVVVGEIMSHECDVKQLAAVVASRV